MTDELSNFDDKPQTRPMFLTILCVITFLFSGFSIISSANQYLKADAKALEAKTEMEKSLTEMRQNPNKSDPGVKIAEKMISSMSILANPENIKKSAIASILTSVFCLIGAFLMWSLNKKGFYLYVIGTLIGIVAPFIIYGATNILAIGSSVFIAFFGIIFVILYAVNLKVMK